MDQAIRRADSIEAGTLLSIEQDYAAAVTPILQRYNNTLKRIEEYSKAGKKGMARALFRSSGLLDELAEAIAAAGAAATKHINAQSSAVLEVMADDDGT